jgi:hypothetical protein
LHASRQKGIELTFKTDDFGAELARFGFVPFHERAHRGALLERKRELVRKLERVHLSGVLVEFRRFRESPYPHLRGTERLPRPRAP